MKLILNYLNKIKTTNWIDYAQNNPLDIVKYIFIFLVVRHIYCKIKAKLVERKYSKVKSKTEFNGARLSLELLHNQGFFGINIERTSNKTGDYYAPKNKMLVFTDKVLNEESIYSVAIGAHETGHFLQHKDNYLLVKWFDKIESIKNIVWMVNPLSIITWGVLKHFGWFIEFSDELFYIGIITYLIGVLIQIIKVQVEKNANKRILKLLNKHDLISDKEEIKGIKKVLKSNLATYSSSIFVYCIYFIADIIDVLYGPKLTHTESGKGILN